MDAMRVSASWGKCLSLSFLAHIACLRPTRMPASWLPGSDNACCVTFRPSQTAGLRSVEDARSRFMSPGSSPGPCCGRDCLRLRSDSLLDRGPIRCALFTAGVGWPRLSLNELGHDSVRHHVTRPRPPGLGRRVARQSCGLSRHVRMSRGARPQAAPQKQQQKAFGYRDGRTEV